MDSPPAAAEPEIARWLWAIEDARRRTRERLAGLNEGLLDWTPPGAGNSLGTLLYHIALIEADWLSVEVLEEPDYPPDLLALFPVPVRDETGRLSPFPGIALADHLARLDTVRARLLATFGAMSLADFRRPRALPGYDATPEWVLHHLLQHEAEHRAEIGIIRALAGEAGGAR